MCSTVDDDFEVDDNEGEKMIIIHTKSSCFFTTAAIAVANALITLRCI